MKMTPAISVKNLTYLYGEKTPFETKAVDNLSADIPKGEFVGLIGHTGSGKSTFVQMLNGLLKPHSGEILFDGENIFKDKAFTKQVRFKIGLCFQYPEYQLFEQSVYKDIAFGPKNMGLSDEEIDSRVKESIRHVGLNGTYLEKSPFDLSGGEKRRVAIAGIIAMRPEVLILDEPTAGLDPRGRDSILSMINRYRLETGCTVILISHSMDDIAKNATWVMVMKESRLHLMGSISEVYSKTQELRSIGLNVPTVTQILLELKEKGYPVRTDIFTTKAAVKELLTLFGKGGGVND